ncbi:hypothetical protein I317_04121 [Kwoniella heveanensis CBS 569]|uniref:Uncharacterized protein n=1 Tax=Kwoniella heveanensis BCC8398 TaxID=1296120 RepID=A0A1B9GR32_9TREE|nr:hypothetical protein I316_04858 [Kwoniella heveanensis BCC8398]OCF42035.1 hypothetical protein I317_04121 [Kwoniella heveanensis CBS 569]
MMGFKKKLTSLLPADARNHLQNALTVEWEGQTKTVLVDLPNTPGGGGGYSRNDDNELEMSGLTGSAAGAGYGRLADDDDDEGYSRSRSNNYNYNYDQPLSQSRSRSSNNRETYESEAYQPSSSSSAYTNFNSYSYSSSASGAGSASNKHKKNSSYSSKGLPPLPPSQSSHGHFANAGSGHAGMRAQNPFEPEYQSPQPSSSSTYSGASPYTSFTPQFQHQSSFAGANDPSSSSFGGGFSNGNGSLGSRGGERKMPNPWGKTYRADDIDLLGDIGSSSGGGGGRGNMTSPTSSRGTRDSSNTFMSEDNRNPFQ